ncbi:hypothetical protein Tco_0557310 [Tanacetum coccineum]
MRNRGVNGFLYCQCQGWEGRHSIGDGGSLLLTLLLYLFFLLWTRCGTIRDVWYCELVSSSNLLIHWPPFSVGRSRGEGDRICFLSLLKTLGVWDGLREYCPRGLVLRFCSGPVGCDWIQSSADSSRLLIFICRILA